MANIVDTRTHAKLTKHVGRRTNRLHDTGRREWKK